MAEPIKLTQEELDELKSIQTTYQEKTFAFGQLYIDKLNINEKIKQLEEIESKLTKDLVDAQKKEQEWIDKISSKYGEGNLSLKDGTFTPKS
jgi:hypothetical protein